MKATGGEEEEEEGGGGGGKGRIGLGVKDEEGYYWIEWHH
jgi:hypothetical protein